MPDRESLLAKIAGQMSLSMIENNTERNTDVTTQSWVLKIISVYIKMVLQNRQGDYIYMNGRNKWQVMRCAGIL